MTTQDLIKYCHFYKGEPLIPSKFDQKDEGKLWVAEKYVCEEIPYLIDEENPCKSMMVYIESYVAKWCPFEQDKVLSVYQSYAGNHRSR